MVTLQAQAQTVQVDVHHVTRVEGHGNIVVDLHNGVLEQCELEIVEAPRFIEAILNGVNYSQAAQIASRICGICAVAHTTTSLRASEKALGVKLSPQTQLLRQIMMYAEILDSHILHTYMLVAPDFFGEGGAISLAKQIPEVVLRALRMKQVAGEICKTIAGRHTHPIAMVGDATADTLYEAGFSSAEELAGGLVEELVTIPGISQQKASKFIDAAKDYLVEQEVVQAETEKVQAEQEEPQAEEGKAQEDEKEGSETEEGDKA